MAHRLTITIPDSLYTALNEAAKRDYRSLSQEIIYLLEKFTPISASTSAPQQFISPGVRSPENPTGQSHTPTANTYYATHNAQGRRTVIG